MKSQSVSFRQSIVNVFSFCFSFSGVRCGMLCLLLCIVGQAWGGTSTLTFTAKCGGSGTADDGAKWTVTSDASESQYEGTKGIHYGTSKAEVTYLTLTTSDISGTITSIKVNASGASGTSAKLSVKVGSTDFKKDDATEVSLTATATEYTFTGSASGTITVKAFHSSSTKKAIYVKSITVTYSSDGGEDEGGESDGDCNIFHETWDGTSGTGGNDDNWSNSIASSTIVADNNDWSVANGSGGANQCIKLGSGSNAGKATTPSITVTTGDTYNLSFRAGAWGTDGTSLTLSAEGATLGETSFTMPQSKWETFSTTITATSNEMKITFTGKKRFFLDDVCISSESCTSPTTELSLEATKTEIEIGETSTISVTTGTGNSESVTYTVTSDNKANATITTAGVFSATVAGTYTVKATQAAKTDGDNKICGGSATIEITVNAAAFTMNIYEQETKNESKSKTSTLPLTLPTADDACDDWTFAGWATGKVNKTTDRPTLFAAGTTVSESGDYYAVYTATEGGGDGTTITKSMTDYVSENSCTVSANNTATMYKTLKLNDDITISTTGEDNCGSFWGTSTQDWRLYQAKKGDVTVSSTADNIVSVKFKYTVSNTGTLLDSNGNTVASDTEYAVNASSVTFTVGNTKSDVTKGQVRITAIEVKYGGGGTTYYATMPECGPTVKPTSSPWVTSTKGETMRVAVEVEVKNFDKAATISASSDNSNFTVLGWGDEQSSTLSVAAETDMTATLWVAYTPTAYDIAKETATISFTISGYTGTATTKTTDATVNGRSLPEQFVIVAEGNSGVYYALRGDMAKANTYSGFEVTPNTDLTEVVAAPEYALYSLQADASNSALGNFTSQDGAAMLWGTVGTADSNHNIKNDKDQKADEADNRAWQLKTTNGIEYELLLPAETSKQLRFYTSSRYFGMYKNGQATLRFMSVGCSTMPTDQNIDNITDNSAVLSWKGSDVAHELTVSDGTNTYTFSNITSPYTIEGLSPNIDYTYTLTPAGNSSCAATGEFHTKKAPITITLHRHGLQDETITDIAEDNQPYPLPTVADPCDEWQFSGWSTSVIDIDDEKNTYTQVTSATTSGDYYAVYKKASSGGTGSTGTLSISYPKSNEGGYQDDYSTIEYTSGSDAITIESNNILKSTSTIQLAKGEGNILWNSTALPGNITQIELEVTSPNGANVYVGTSELSSVDADNALSATSISDGTYTYNITGTNTYFAIGATSRYVGMSSITITYGEGSSAIYATNPDCIPCTESGVQFTYPSLEKTTASKDFTNAVVFTKQSSAGTQTFTSSNQDVATIDGNGKVHIVGKGETTITLKLGRDDSNAANPICGDVITYLLTVTDPVVEVVGVTDQNEIIIEHDFEGITTASLEEAVTTVEGSVAEDIFISKYYEAASNMKLFALYNGTEHNIDMSKLRLRSNYGTDWAAAGQVGYIEFGTISKLGKEYPGYILPPFTEVIFWSNNYGSEEVAKVNNETLRECVEMTIDGITYDIDDMEQNKIPNWYCLGDYVTYGKQDADGNNQIVFNGDDALILERTEDNGVTWTAIDLFGSGDSDAPVVATGTGNGYIQKISSINDNPGGYYWDATSSAGVELSTNRFYLMRNKGVLSGADAVEKNKTYFQTLGSEWHGKGVGADYSAYCESGEYFSEVAEYDYSNYYTEYKEVSEELWNATNNGDGTMTIKINEGLADYACKYLRIEVKDESGTTAKIEYKVPIIVKETTDVTKSELFNKHTEAICQTCDVAILEGGVLTKSSVTDDPDDRDWVRNVDVYPGGELYIPKNTTYTVNTLTIRSEGDKVGKADIQGTLERLNTTLIHSKRLNTVGINYRWYYFSLPYDCNIADVTFSNGEPAKLNTDFYIDWYDGQLRAQTQRGGNWKSIAEHPTFPNIIKAGYGYTLAVEPIEGHDNVELYFPMANFTEIPTELQVPVGNWGAGDDNVRPNHKGWNLIGNPFLTHYTAQEHLDTNGELRTGLLVQDEVTGYWSQEEGSIINYTITPKDGGVSGYEQEKLTGYDFSPFMAYIIQVGGNEEKDGLYVTLKNEHKNTRNIVRRSDEEIEDLRTVWVQLNLSNTAGEQDKTTLLISDRYTEDYDVSNDLAKWRGDSYRYFTYPILATETGGYEYAFNAIPDATAAERIPMHYFSKTAGTMRLSLSDKYQWDALSEVMLYDSQEEIYHNLLTSGDYEFNTAAGDNNSRFYLTVRVNRNNLPEVVTAETIEELRNVRLTSQDRQLLFNGLATGTEIYVFDMQGKLIAHRLSAGGFLKIAMPTAGVYNVRLMTNEGGQTLRTIVK